MNTNAHELFYELNQTVVINGVRYKIIHAPFVPGCHICDLHIKNCEDFCGYAEDMTWCPVIFKKC